MKLRWPTTSKKDKVASQNSSFEKDAIVIQSFLRGALCRARVNRMVQKLIDDILLKRKNAATSSRKTEDDDDSSINVIDDEHNNNNNNSNSKMDGSSISIDVLDIILPKNIKDSSKKEANEDMQESVSDILLKIEANIPESNEPPTRKWSPVKKSDDPPPVKKSDDPKIDNDQKLPISSSPPIHPTQTDTQKKICFVKDANLQSNATKRQTTSEKYLQEHEVSVIQSYIFVRSRWIEMQKRKICLILLISNY
jgi:hypothetical protein